MKRVILVLTAIVGLALPVFAGGETHQQRDHANRAAILLRLVCKPGVECVAVGTYAFTGTDWPDDRYLAVDHAWGGGADFKFFFARYFGLGAKVTC